MFWPIKEKTCERRGENARQIYIEKKKQREKVGASLV